MGKLAMRIAHDGVINFADLAQRRHLPTARLRTLVR
jgi:hypothetical protein